ncbi:hypothetical protein FA95DRAFT_1551711 [Auriscalpium vulgare]|uniref:Uncharacterized protein n=1 Tax=Auriscalpium vulgare TaxID=40419 RepID=A0ACB8SDJ9_9AGAM|nr:hypothetical protein FA95DRAFT_1551711 [Auriscalpium vulgare]
MSIDLEWTKLDSSLASSLVQLLNTQLQNAARPSFIGPIEVTSFDFGSQSPDVEIVDLRNIYRDFLEDEDEDEDADGAADHNKRPGPGDEDDGFEWVSRRNLARGMAEEAPAYHHLPPHVRYGRGPASHLFSPSLGPSFGSAGVPWNGAMSLPSLSVRPSYYEHPTAAYRPASSAQPLAHPLRSSVSLAHPTADPSPSSSFDRTPQTPEPQEQPDPDAPNMQLHLHVTWHSNLRLTLTTSLLINYPSPMFMSLPIKLSVIGLVFNGELAIAYEGSRKRVHLCVLDDNDPYGPAGDRMKRESQTSTPPSDPDADLEGLGLPSGATADSRSSKPLPVGQRLLPNIFIESELGQADKHVLKNVTRVEKFIQDVIRKTVEEELVFPNFHTVVLG